MKVAMSWTAALYWIGQGYRLTAMSRDRNKTFYFLREGVWQAATNVLSGKSEYIN